MKFDGYAFDAPDIRETALPRRGSIYAGKMQSLNDGCIYWLALSEAGPIKICLL